MYKCVERVLEAVRFNLFLCIYVGKGNRSYLWEPKKRFIRFQGKIRESKMEEISVTFVALVGRMVKDGSPVCGLLYLIGMGLVFLKIPEIIKKTLIQLIANTSTQI